MDIKMTWWKAAAAAVALMAGASGAAAQGRPAGTAGVTGSWKVSLHGQHIIPVGMELTQDGGTVTGPARSCCGTAMSTCARWDR